MASTAEELIVALKAEGAEKVNQSIQEVDEGMQEVTDSVEETGEELEGFTQQFKGAMAAAVAALAVGVAGLASQVPVVGELLSGVGAIIDALIFQVDGLIRAMGAGGLTQTLFNVSDAIFGLEGAAGNIVGALTIIGTAVGAAISGFLAFIAQTQGLAAAFGMVKAGVSTVVSTLSGLVSGVAVAAGAVGAFLGLITVGVLEVLGINDALRNMGELVANNIPASLRDMAIVALGAITTIGAAILGFVKGTLDGGLSEGFSRAAEMAKQAFGVVMDAFDRLVSSFLSKLRTLLDTAQEIIGKIKSGLSADLSINGNASTSSGGNIGTGTITNGGGGSNITLDGRDITEDTGRFRQDALSRRGL